MAGQGRQDSGKGRRVKKNEKIRNLVVSDSPGNQSDGQESPYDAKTLSKSHQTGPFPPATHASGFSLPKAGCFGTNRMPELTNFAVIRG
jgi:hypothetical protein